MASEKWTDWQLKLAFYLYCQLPFGRLHNRNPEIIALAKLIGRTPSAVALKLVNFASLDPSITDSGRKGMGNSSSLDKKIWEEFNADWEGLALDCEKIRRELQTQLGVADSPEPDELDAAPADYTGETRRVTSEQRIKQNFFRKAVLSSYEGKCCMTELAEPRLLIASHIVPWSKDKKNRLNPSNGLCLSALHDRAFDLGFISVRPDFSIAVSKAVTRLGDNPFTQSALIVLEGSSIFLPKRFLPSPEFLQNHYTSVFQG
jgi:predicted restriction endonuclease